MNLFLRLLRFLAVLIVLLVRLLLPILLTTLRALLGLISLSFAATVNDPGKFIDRLAAEWTRRLLALGAPRERIDPIYRFCRVLAGTTIVLGWVVAGIFTVEILRVVFGFFI
jgi:hypothetical protein